MATDRGNIDMHGKSADTGGEKDRTILTQISRPEHPRAKSSTACSTSDSISKPTAGEVPGTSSRTYQSSEGRDYKSTHPIGSRKVTENVVTYHEPMFQSLANIQFETQKNLSMGKRKIEEERGRAESVSPDSKKKKLENVKANISDPIVKIKKKCSIENIIDRIRTEKTMSRGSGPGSVPFSAGSATSESTAGSQQTDTHAANLSSPSKAVNQKESIEDQPEKFSSSRMFQEISYEMSKQSFKQKHSDIACKTETSVSPQKFTSAKPMESANQVKEEIKQELKESCSPVKFTKLVEASTERDIACKPDVVGKKSSGNISPKKTAKVSLSKDDVSKAFKYQKVKEIKEETDVQLKVKKKPKGKDKDLSSILTDKKAKVRKKKSDTDQEQRIYTPVKTTKKNVKAKHSKELKPEKEQDKKADKKSKKSEEGNGKLKDEEKNEPSDKKQKGKKPKADKGKSKKQKLPVFQVRVKRLASLNASTFMNIMYEKSPPKTPRTLNSKRSKSESDLASTPQRALASSLSLTSVVNTGESQADSQHESSGSAQDSTSFSSQSDLKSALKSPKMDQTNPKGNSESKKGALNKSKNNSPKRKISFSDEVYFENESSNDVFSEYDYTSKGESSKSSKSVKKGLAKLDKSTDNKSNRGRKQYSAKSQGNNKKRNKVLPVKSPEEVAERKKKANLARLKKAKQLLRAKRQKTRDEANDDINIDIESSSDRDEKQSSSDDSLSSPEKADENTVIKNRAKRGELFRSARTHVSVESKKVFENTASSPKWCECCETSYFPSQPHQGMKVWLLKQLVDKGSSRSPEPIQSSSHHFINAHASCEVQPYSSPTHVPMLESSPYVSPLVSHGHVTCSGCGCGHGGMLHTAQCQNYSLGGVSNILSCQHYSGAYTVPYSHSSYTRCGCTSCYPGNSYHHAASQPLLHQPQIPITTDASILLHRGPVQLQRGHEAPHSSPHSSPHSVPIQLSHSDSGLSSHSLPLHLSHTDTSMPQHLAQSCHCLPGEVTNVSQVGSNTQTDMEYIDVGNEELTKTQTGTPVAKKSGIKNGTGPNLAADVIKLKKTNKNSETIKEKLKHSREQLNEKLRVNKLLNNIEKLQTKVKGQKNVEELMKKSKILEIKKKKVSASNPQLEKGTKKVSDKKAAGKKSKKEVGKSVCEEEEEEVAMAAEREEMREEPRAWHGWTWEGEGCMKTVVNIFDGKEVQRKCYNAIKHEDEEIIRVKDCILVCAGRKMRDIPYVAKVTNFWDDPDSGEMMMTLLWYYRPEHIEGGRKPEHEKNELFAAKHRDESLVACIEDRGYVLTYNEFCRYMGDVQRTKCNFPTRKKVVPDLEEMPESSRMPPVDVDPDNVFLCRHVYDLKLKRVLKNPS